MFVLLIVLAIISVANCRFLDTTKDTIVVDVKYGRNCLVNTKNTFDLFVATKKYNRTHIGVDFNANVTDIIDRRYELMTEVRLWSDGGWKRNLFHDRRRDPCATLKLLFGPLWKKGLEAAHCPPGCPFKHGYYHFRDYNFDISHVPILFQDGRFYIIVHIMKDNVSHACFEAEYEVKKLVS